MKFQAQLAEKKRLPDYSIEQVLTVAQEGESTIRVLAGYLAYLTDVGSVLDGALRPDGRCFMFCNNIDLLAKYRTKIDDITCHILPCDESTV